MKNRRVLTEHERSTITNALNIAIEQFRKDSKLMRGANGNRHLAEQFDRQIADAEAVVDGIESAEEVILT